MDTGTHTRTHTVVATPEVSQGLATKLGKFGALALACATVLTTVLPGDHSGDTHTFAWVGGVILAATIIGRMLQAAAAIFGTK